MICGVAVVLSDAFVVDVVSAGFGCVVESLGVSVGFGCVADSLGVSVGFDCVRDSLGLSVGCWPTDVVGWDTVVCTVSVLDGWAALGCFAEGVAWAEPAAVDCTVLEVEVTVGLVTLGCCGSELVDSVAVAMEGDAEGV